MPECGGPFNWEHENFKHFLRTSWLYFPFAMNTIILQNGKTAIMNMEKMKKGKKKGTVKKFLDLFDDLFRIGLDFFRLCYNKDSESIYAGRSHMAQREVQ